jgi:hypothetical protein
MFCMTSQLREDRSVKSVTVDSCDWTVGQFLLAVEAFVIPNRSSLGDGGGVSTPTMRTPNQLTKEIDIIV